MATIGKDPNGTRRILFVASDGARRTVRLGKVPMKVANEVKARVESLNAAKVAGVALDADTAAWTARIGADTLSDRITAGAADLGSRGGTAFPTGTKKGLEFQPCHPESLPGTDEKYARQESNL